MTREIGRIKTWNERGFGFAAREGTTDIFIHCSALPPGLRELAVGTPVSFVTVPSRNGGEQAVDVRVER
jgi:cold shock CspA family protein